MFPLTPVLLTLWILSATRSVPALSLKNRLPVPELKLRISVLREFPPPTVKVFTLMVLTPAPKLSVNVLVESGASINSVVATIVLVVGNFTVTPKPDPLLPPPEFTSAPTLNVPVPRYMLRLANALISQFT